MSTGKDTQKLYEIAHFAVDRPERACPCACNTCEQKCGGEDLAEFNNQNSATELNLASGGGPT